MVFPEIADTQAFSMLGEDVHPETFAVVLLQDPILGLLVIAACTKDTEINNKIERKSFLMAFLAFAMLEVNVFMIIFFA